MRCQLLSESRTKPNFVATLTFGRLTRDEVQRYYERYIAPYFTSDGRVDKNVAQHAVAAFATELGVAAASVDQMYQPALWPEGPVLRPAYLPVRPFATLRSKSDSACFPTRFNCCSSCRSS